MARIAANSFSARLNASFLKIACAVAAGSSQTSSCRSDALNTASGEPNCLSNRAESRAAMPRVNNSASQERAESSCTERCLVRAAYAIRNLFVNCLESNRSPACLWLLRCFAVGFAKTDLQRRVFREHHIFSARQKIVVHRAA